MSEWLRIRAGRAIYIYKQPAVYINRIQPLPCRRFLLSYFILFILVLTEAATLSIGMYQVTCGFVAICTKHIKQQQQQKPYCYG